MKADGLTISQGSAGYIQLDHDLSKNELHLDPLPRVCETLRDRTNRVNRYPEAHSVAKLTTHIAALHAVTPEQVVIGPGSIGVLDAVLHSSHRAGGSTMFGVPTFYEYSTLASRAGRRCIEVSSNPPGWQALECMLSRVDSSTREVIVTTPHNPTGAAVPVDELISLSEQLPPTVLMIVDQAYAEFDDTFTPDGVGQIISECQEVVILRSFSKAYGLAGLRIGYGLFGSAQTAAQVRASIPMFSVNSLALVAAQESLRHQEQLRDRVADLIDNRRRLEAFLSQHNLFSGIKSQGNFVWIPTARSGALMKHALADGILLREYPGLGVRITVQSDASVDAVMRSLVTFSKSSRRATRGDVNA